MLLGSSLGLDLGGLGLGDLSGLLDLSIGSELLGGNADENDNLGLDLAVQRDGNGVGTGNLDGLAELDALAVYLSYRVCATSRHACE